MNNYKTRKIGFWLLVVVLGLVAAGVGLKVFTEPVVAPEDAAGTGYFDLAIDYGDKQEVYENIAFNVGETIFSATQQLTSREGIEFSYQDYGDMGMLVVSIGEKGGGDSDAYWQYWVNGEYAQVGASAYEIQNNDRIEWKFSNAQQ